MTNQMYLLIAHKVYLNAILSTITVQGWIDFTCFVFFTPAC